MATPDGSSVFVTADNGLIHKIDLATGDITKLQGHTGRVRRLSLSQDGNVLISCGSHNHAVVWNTETLFPEIILKCPAEYKMEDSFNNPVFSPDASLAMIGTNNGKCLVMDVRSGQLVDVLAAGEGRCVVGIDRSGRQIVTAAERDKVKIWAVTPRSP